MLAGLVPPSVVYAIHLSLTFLPFVCEDTPARVARKTSPFRMDIYLSPALPLQARRQASNANDLTTGRNAYTCQLPAKHVDLPLRAATYVEEEDDFPTPKASQHLHAPLNSPGAASSCYSPLRESIMSQHTAFEEDKEGCSSDNDSDILPFQVSDSIKKKIKARAHHGRAPSLVIPSPHLWATIERIQKSAVLPPKPSMLTPKTPLSPAALAELGSSQLRVPVASTATPSLAESLTTDEQASLGCPSTPDSQSVLGEEQGWDPPIQLHPTAMETLFHLCSLEESCGDISNSAIPSLQQEHVEMQDRGLSLYNQSIPKSSDETECSPISIPSPRVFFASLASSSSIVWSSGPEKDEPNTSTAETFYGIPWVPPRRALESNLEEIAELDENGTDAPLTARRILPDTALVAEPESSVFDAADDCRDDFEALEIYMRKMSESAEGNRTRTDDWIEAQERYITALKDAPSISDGSSSSTEMHGSETNTAPPSVSLSAKKTVRFAESVEQHSEETAGERPCDSILYHAFQHLRVQGKPRDAYIHRNSRLNALRMQRLYMKDVHHSRLRGSFDLKSGPKAKQHWLHATSTEPEDKETLERWTDIASAGKEQRALQQLSLNSWTLQAMRFLDGGSLIPQSSLDLLYAEIASGNQARILDFGGQPTAGWGWAVATEHREVKVYTAVPTNKGIRPDWLAHRGPSNHRIASVPNTWTLPFPDGMFNVISARSLHTLLRTNSFPLREGEGGDEYDATLSELHRVLAPGGVIHFSLLDAEMSAPANSALGAKSIEFAVSLRTRGYDPCAGRHIVPRLEKAGFEDVRRSWVSLPWASKRSDGTDAITGLVGSVAWEQWVLKFQEETGKTEDQLLDGVAQALDEARAANDGSADGAAWRMLVGCATKM